MDDLAKRTLTRVIWMHIAMALLIFVPAWSLRYWQAWLWWLVFGLPSLAITRYFLKHDRPLLERRLKVGPVAETERSQKLIMSFAGLCIVSVLVVPALDHRLGWSSVPVPVVLAADAVIALGFWMTIRVLCENSFASSTIQVVEGQRVIATGPYAVVRHPMYAAGIPMIVATPFALGSWWGLLPAAGMCGVIVWRLLDEEQYLERNLPGYAEYRQTVRWRLVPGVW